MKYFNSLAITFGLIAILVYFSVPTKEQQAQALSDAIGSISNLDPSDTPATATKDRYTTVDTDDYQQCWRFFYDTHQLSAKWAGALSARWQDFSDEGYSLDDMTLAKEYAYNDRAAAMYRVKKLRELTPYTKDSKELEDEAFNMFPNLKKVVSAISRPVPSPQLSTFLSLTSAQKSQLLMDTEVYVEDVAHFMLKPASDQDIIMLLAKLDNPSQVVGEGRLNAISLIDFAAYSARPTVLERLIELGVMPTSDVYLGSTMEWALVALSSSLDTEKEARAAQVVTMLQQFDAPARFSERSHGFIQGKFPRKSYIFKQEKIASLINDYGLDLMQISERKPLTVNTNNPLVKRLEAEKSQYLSNIYGEQHHQKIWLPCKQSTKSKDKLWQPKTTSELLTELTTDNSEFNSNEALAAVHPSLSDLNICFDETAALRLNRGGSDAYYSRSKREKQALEVAHELFDQNKPQEAIQSLLAITFDPSNRARSMEHILKIGKNHLLDVVNSPLRFEPFEFYNGFLTSSYPTPVFIQQLLDAGMDLNQPDNLGKGLVFYAAASHNARLLEYLYNQRFDFEPTKGGMDPLHVALSNIVKHRIPEHFEATIDQLMKFQPKIDKFHLAQMKVLSIYFANTYQSLTERYPELQINDKIELPNVRVTGCGYRV